MNEMRPHNAQTMMDKPEDPADCKTPFGLMKIPEPTIEPTIIAIPSISPNWRSIATFPSLALSGLFLVLSAINWLSSV